MKIYCILHSRNLRSNSTVITIYMDQKKCSEHLEEILVCLSTIQKIKTKAKKELSTIKDLHPEFDDDMNRTVNDIYWIQVVELKDFEEQ